MTLDEIKDPRLRERVTKQIAQEDAAKRRSHQPVGGLASPQPQPNQVRALERKPSALKSRKRGVVIVVTFTSHRNSETDDDNCGSGTYKSMRDAVARSLAVDDRDRRITWEYRQVVTQGRPGTHVTITRKL